MIAIKCYKICVCPFSKKLYFAFQKSISYTIKEGVSKSTPPFFMHKEDESHITTFPLCNSLNIKAFYG